MTLPHISEARFYYQAAKQRFEDARFLLQAGRTTGAIYLAGYSVECMLKAFILSRVSDQRRAAIIKEFRGNKAHDYEWLKKRFLGEVAFTNEITQLFVQVNSWSTHLRYRSATVKHTDAISFLDASERIIHWIDGRL